MKDEFTLYDMESWPADVKAFFDLNASFYRNWFFASRGCEEGAVLAKKYDQLHEEFTAILESFSLRAYHCTRLTEAEIADIKKNGVVPLSPGFLERRIRQLGLREDVTELLLNENRVDEKYRQNGPVA